MVVFRELHRCTVTAGEGARLGGVYCSRQVLGACSPYRDHQSAKDHLGGEDIRGGVRRFGVLVVVVRRPKVVRLH